jgi:dihydrofolate reductase
MRKIVAGLLMSLDGVVESPDVWGWPRFMSGEMSRGIVAGIAQADAVLIGRRTYEQFAAMWPHQPSEVPMANFLNKSPKYVVSTTLRGPLEWANSTVLTGPLGEELARIKNLPGTNIQVPGSPGLVRSLLREGLLDVLNVSICPIIVGSGMRLFEGIGEGITLELVHSMTLANGVLGLTYRPGRVDHAVVEPRVNFPTAAAGDKR